jgi:succinate-semialdehyde dehydrogenase/glutarate-semialdehyde dehydrogenase
MTVTVEREKSLLAQVPTGLLIGGQWRDSSSGASFGHRGPRDR